MAAVNWYISKERNYKGIPGNETFAEKMLVAWKAIPALLLPVIILGGMRAGWFTPTEASVVAVFYALVCGKWIYRTLEWKAVPDILSRSALMTASVLIIIGTSNAFAWILTIDGLPIKLAEWMGAQEMSAFTFLIAVNIFLLIFGIFIEPLPGVMVLVPILAPVAAKLGIDPIHFAMVVIFNLTLGMITPPVGATLRHIQCGQSAFGCVDAGTQTFLNCSRHHLGHADLHSCFEHLGTASTWFQINTRFTDDNSPFNHSVSRRDRPRCHGQRHG